MTLLCLVAASLQGQLPPDRTAGPPPPPSEERRKEMLLSIKRSGEAYVKDLPVFWCVQRNKPNASSSRVTIDLDLPHRPQPDVILAPVDAKKIIRNLFSIGADSNLEWDHWGTLRGKRMTVFRFTQQESAKEYRGLLYADEYTGAVSRISITGPDLAGSASCWSEE